MSKMITQRQLANGGSIALAAGRDIILHRGLTRSEVADIAKVVLDELVKTTSVVALPLTTPESSAQADSFAQLHAKLAEAKLDRDDVRMFLLMASALDHEIRLSRAFGQNRVACPHAAQTT